MNVNSFQDREYVNPCQGMAQWPSKFQAANIPRLTGLTLLQTPSPFSEIMDLEFHSRSKTAPSFDNLTRALAKHMAKDVTKHPANCISLNNKFP